MPETPQRIVIITGGNLGAWMIGKLRPDDYIIGADAGALFLVRSGICPDLSLGDFDSVTEEEMGEIIRGTREMASFDPIDKNYTDTELALMRAIERKPSSILIFGALGSRFDHSLANVHLLRKAAECGCAAVIEDASNRIQLIQGGQTLTIQRSDLLPHVSLLPLSEEVHGINLEGFQYPLHDATLRIGQSLGISNVLANDVGTIRSSKGWLLVMETAG
ncbi:thiamine diphosphokinase [Paenibacillus herberti]|uniref:Thiamine diphosphokinase n=1 Tax=Paenibacillus herberti TaxID=1619309 RepID=A0A229P2E7_9BACL|nr:thiamine diphosphokinase [Paenibacillus herberti]OXM16433.1 thiamine diphosphokinase [Paenibacillus herberti]